MSRSKATTWMHQHPATVGVVTVALVVWLVTGPLAPLLMAWCRFCVWVGQTPDSIKDEWGIQVMSGMIGSFVAAWLCVTGKLLGPHLVKGVHSFFAALGNLILSWISNPTHSK